MFLAIVVPLALEAALGSSGLALGSDPAIWGLTSLNLSHGAPSNVPPVYSWLIAIADGLSSGEVVAAATRVTIAAFALASGATYVVARVLGASRALAFGAGLLMCAQGEMAALALQLQPETLVMLIMVAAVPVILWFMAAPTLRRAVGLAVFGGLAYATREHGAVLVGGLFVLAAAVPGAPLLRVARAGVVGLAILLAPMLALSRPALPWDAIWSGRVGVAVQLQESFASAGKGAQATAEIARHRELHAQGDRVAIAAYHAQRAISGAAQAWSWIALGAVAAAMLPRNRRIAIWLTLAPAVPTLLILSQPRHVLVLVPVALVSVAAALQAEVPARWRAPARASLATVAVGLSLWGASRWEYSLTPVRENVIRATKDRTFGTALCQMRGSYDLISGETYSYMVYCPMRNHKVIRTLSDGDWRTLYVGAMPPTPYWRPSQLSYQSAAGTLYVYSLAPWIGSGKRPCQGSRVPDDAPYLTLNTQQVALEPPCGGTANLALLSTPFQ